MQADTNLKLHLALLFFLSLGWGAEGKGVPLIPSSRGALSRERGAEGLKVKGTVCCPLPPTPHLCIFQPRGDSWGDQSGILLPPLVLPSAEAQQIVAFCLETLPSSLW